MDKNLKRKQKPQKRKIWVEFEICQLKLNMARPTFESKKDCLQRPYTKRFFLRTKLFLYNFFFFFFLKEVKMKKQIVTSKTTEFKRAPSMTVSATSRSSMRPSPWWEINTTTVKTQVRNKPSFGNTFPTRMNLWGN